MGMDIWTDKVVVGRELADRYGLEEGLELIRKMAANYKTAGSIDDEKRTITSIISTADVDRDGDVLRPDGLDEKAYRRHPIVLFGHRYHELPIGRNEWIKVEGKRVLAKTVYVPGDINAQAERIFQFRKQGFPLAQSIGFIADLAVWAGEEGFEAELDDLEARGWLAKKDRSLVRRVIKKWTLYEYSDVVVPANPEAVALAVGKGLLSKIEAKELAGVFPVPGDDLPKKGSDPEPAREHEPVLKYLAGRLIELEAEKADRDRELAILKSRTSSNLNLDSLEKVLPIIVKVFQQQSRERNRDTVMMLARMRGRVTIAREARSGGA